MHAKNKTRKTSKSPHDWMEVRPEGLFCKPGGFYIDPIRPVRHALITHGHADHARAGHECVMATPETLAIMGARNGPDFAEHKALMPYGEITGTGGVGISFHPAGHILGSAQILLEYSGARLVISGDYKREADPTCAPFALVPCDVFVTEATFGLPVFRSPPVGAEIDKLLTSLRLFPQRAHVVGVYALGKCQRLIRALRDQGYDRPIYLHGALVKLCELYEAHGAALGELVRVSEAYRGALAGEIVLCPPGALADRWSRRLPNVLPVMASGWMQVRARAKQRRVELPLIISDHADWADLIRTIRETGAREVWVTHGREDALVHQAKTMGLNARALSLIGYEEDTAD